MQHRHPQPPAPVRWVAAALAVGVALAVAPSTSAQAGAAGSPPSATSATALLDVDAYATIQCEDYDEQNGIHLEAHNGGLHAGFISTGDWLRFDRVTFTDLPARRMTLRASNAARQNRTGRVELRLDSVTNPPAASMVIPNNGDWLTFVTYELSIPPTTGVHTVFLTFTSTQDEEFANMDWIIFRH